jgi:hypothetical protein
MHLFYRISDKSYPKVKLPGSNKKVCLQNFCSAFQSIIFTEESLNGIACPPMLIVSDNVELRETKKLIQETGIPSLDTKLGNAGALLFCIEEALKLPDEEIVYFVEDDYLHLGNAYQVLKEGISVADYVTLYDHPDKYTHFYDFGEVSKVVKTQSTHWRYTGSTCMTFGVKVKELREDADVWREHLKDQAHPDDFKIFNILVSAGRKLGVSIPGVAVHTDLAFSGVMNTVNIGSWAIEMMIDKISKELDEVKDEEFQLIRQKLTSDLSGWDLLKYLDAFRFNINKKAV